jgi:hypothetical protein
VSVQLDGRVKKVVFFFLKKKGGGGRGGKKRRIRVMRLDVAVVIVG